MRDLEALKEEINETPEGDWCVFIMRDYLEQIGDLKKSMNQMQAIDDETTVFPQVLDTIVDKDGGETQVNCAPTQWILMEKREWLKRREAREIMNIKTKSKEKLIMQLKEQNSVALIQKGFSHLAKLLSKN